MNGAITTMIHQMNLHVRPFDMIASGQKTIELRLYDEKRRALQVGDTIEFTSTDRDDARLCCEIVALHRFSSFEELYKTLPLLKCGYTAEDVADASPADMDFYYTKEKQKAHGVLGIELKLI